MTSEHLKICEKLKFDYLSGMERGFEVKQRTFFLVSELLSFRYTKQTSKNVAATTFKGSQ